MYELLVKQYRTRQVYGKTSLTKNFQMKSGGGGGISGHFNLCFKTCVPQVKRAAGIVPTLKKERKKERNDKVNIYLNKEASE